MTDIRAIETSKRGGSRRRSAARVLTALLAPAMTLTFVVMAALALAYTAPAILGLLDGSIEPRVSFFVVSLFSMPALFSGLLAYRFWRAALASPEAVRASRSRLAFPLLALSLIGLAVALGDAVLNGSEGGAAVFAWTLYSLVAAAPFRRSREARALPRSLC